MLLLVQSLRTENTNTDHANIALIVNLEVVLKEKDFEFSAI